jgi:hypothetical protein
VGFDFERNPEQIELAVYNKDHLQAAQEAINLHVMSLGGQVQTGEKFDPFKPVISSTTYSKVPVVSDKDQTINVYDPSAV